MSENGWEKMGIRDLWKVAKCGHGLHLRIPPKIERAFDLKTGDTIRVNLVEVQHADMTDEEGGE